jgi:hypothetical protein
MPISKIKSNAINDNTITTAKLVDSAVTIAKTNNLFVNTEITGTEAARMPVGTTAQRANAQAGDLRHNSSLGILEQYTSGGWQGIASPPVATSISPTDINESDSTQTIVISGSNFDSGAVGTLKNASSATISPTTSTRNSSSQITIVFSGSDVITTDAGPYDVVVTNGSGLAATLEDALTLDNSPAWSTAAGTIATGYERLEDTRKVWWGNYSAFTLTSSSSLSGRTPAGMFAGLFGGGDGWANALSDRNSWWQIDMGHSVVLSKFTYYNHDGHGNKTSHKLQGSNDGTNFTDIYNKGQLQNFIKVDDSPGSTAYRYWRIFRSWSSDNYGSMGGLEIEYTPHVDDALYNGSDVSVTLSATDPEGGSVTYAKTSGAFPSGVALSGAVISGVLNGGNSDYNASGVTHNATITASDADSNTAPRTFNIIRKWYDGTSSANAALNAESIRLITGADKDDDGTYWIKPHGRNAIQIPCEFNSMGGWMLFAASDGSSSPVPTGSSASGTVAIGSKGKIDDADMNAIDWNHCWHGMTVNDTDTSGFLMDPNRQVFSVQNNDGGTSHGLQFTIIWQRAYDQWTGGNTGNGRNISWSYKGTNGSGGNGLLNSTRQNGTVINSTGSTDYDMINSNTYGVSPHEAGGGGAWMHSTTGSSGNFNTGFGSDSNNMPWTSRYAYWFFGGNRTH